MFDGNQFATTSFPFEIQNEQAITLNYTFILEGPLPRNLVLTELFNGDALHATISLVES